MSFLLRQNSIALVWHMYTALLSTAVAVFHGRIEIDKSLNRYKIESLLLWNANRKTRSDPKTMRYFNPLKPTVAIWVQL